ncbi:MAG TPA: GtrA family protein [Accumulibacter sp.]|uniref:GtrA family protein n=1 Tax=Accumulibacter sp. TaxID=2053492 RepID=UPI002CFA6AB0|nr:GtrA family protein [Accumulibacter sp.]HNG16754.1 GtrA family protein [Accumulibacter sp.]HNN83734.1 GtrA family protein [Accumulibacter sp.]
MKQVLRQIGWFVGVGCAAAATHWAVAVAGIGRLQLAPAVANLLGWLVALLVSFSGHYLLTFRHHAKSLWPALGRFFLLSAGGFAVNELAFVVLLNATSLPYQHLLAAILVAVAGLTFVLSRSWAFRRSP